MQQKFCPNQEASPRACESDLKWLMFPDMKCRFLGLGCSFKLSTIAAKFRNLWNFIKNVELFSQNLQRSLRVGVSGKALSAAGLTIELQWHWNISFLMDIRKCSHLGWRKSLYYIRTTVYCLKRNTEEGKHTHNWFSFVPLKAWLWISSNPFLYNLLEIKKHIREKDLEKMRLCYVLQV